MFRCHVYGANTLSSHLRKTAHRWCDHYVWCEGYSSCVDCSEFVWPCETDVRPCLVCESKRNPNYVPFLCTLPSKGYFQLPHQVFHFGSSTYWHLSWHSRTPQSQEDSPPGWCTSVHVVFPALDQQSPPCLWIDWLTSFIDACRCYKVSSPGFLVDW